MNTMTSGRQPLYEEKHKKPKPQPSMQLSQIEGKPDYKLGDTVTLTITGKVRGMGEDDYVEGNPYYVEFSEVSIKKGD